MFWKLRKDVHIAALDSGVRVDVDGRTARLTGPTASALLDRLRPLLDGAHDVSAVIGRLPVSQQKVVEDVLSTLAACGALRDATQDRLVPLKALDEQVYGQTLDYLDTFGPGGRAVFARLREHPVAVIGTGSALRVLAPALWEAGVRRGRVSLLPDQDELRTALAARLKEQMDLDPGLDWHVDSGKPWGETDCQPPALVVIVGEYSVVQTEQRHWEDRLVASLPVVYSRDHATIGPLCQPGSPGLCCVERRVPFLSPRPDTATAWAYTGARAALEAFKVLGGLDHACSGTLIRIDAAQLTDSLHPVLPSGTCEHSPLTDAEEMTAGWDRPVNNESEVLPAGFADPLSGMLSSLDPEDAPQLPLPLTVVRPHQGPGLVVPGRTHAEARLSGALSGLQHLLPAAPGENDRHFAFWNGQLDLTVPVSLPALPLNWTPVVAESGPELLGCGLLWHLAKAVEPTGGPLTLSELDALLGDEAAGWWKALTLRYAKQPSVYIYPLPGAGHGASADGVRTVGRSRAQAVETALLHLLARTQQRDGWARGAETRSPERPRPLVSLRHASVDWNLWLAERFPRWRVRVSLSREHLPLHRYGLFAGWVAVETQS